MSQGSVIAEEIARFDALAARWWDARGPMRPLHMLNPVRAGWVAQRVRRAKGEGVSILDVGCGAGLLAEALAKDGFAVTGLDAGAEVIDVARGHAQGQGLNITYRHGTAEGLAAEGASFPVVTALEIIEHVADPLEFLKSLRALLAPGGVLFLSTLNRTPQSYAVAKFGAEYVLRLLPVGTHDWKMFIKPEELGRLCRQAGLRLTDTAGLSYSPRQAGFTVSRDLSVNYIAMAVAA
ncbi:MULTISPECIES: bifunctional 2-polyprenyl-6-hydroxyphenol methylase/3-demethylubiquinol 3-O-methyltransferase UbiG [Acidocella]|uniref:bifunctional 2-polyprenyl-6-hydroxyphenol methylase/3-demethylubiquinol 3-O-methyltransferase UbiG n=1 Tax=Acidocella TaxID=50709 RepID=UPI00028E3B66|nr:MULTISPECIES: bifunctional 2-polyprenyl-6-hydroxyphenol methylase/3-demethylubiquinol 3-O-methyltransferase UbiG [Acidocella]EKN00839.1 3-demethylubiquinone-9 3-methyltransferase [Acidocella sp. MX-AZ02]